MNSILQDLKMWHEMLTTMLVSGHQALVIHSICKFTMENKVWGSVAMFLYATNVYTYGSRFQKPLVKLKSPNNINSAKIFVKIPPFHFLG